ncbi:hypothetical protein Tco_0595385 [Tanacetum coccineum]
MNSGDVLENTSSVSCKGISSGGRWMSKCFSDMNGDLQEDSSKGVMRIIRDFRSREEVRREVLSFLEIDWLAGHQRSTAISTTEAEYFAMSGCCAQIPLDEIQLNDSSLLFNKIPLVL